MDDFKQAVRTIKAVYHFTQAHESWDYLQSITKDYGKLWWVDANTWKTTEKTYKIIKALGGPNGRTVLRMIEINMEGSNEAKQV